MTLKNSENSKSTSELDDSLSNEENRILSLLEYNIDFITPEPGLDKITKLLAIICETSIACVTLLDSSKVWFKSKIGLECICTEKAISFCKYVIEQNDIFEISDAYQDQRFSNHPMVIDSPGIRFYAGIPLITPSGYNIGVLCVIDKQPKKLTESQRHALILLSQHVIMSFELTKSNRELKIANEKANKSAKAKEDFLCNISHEIRTPLNAIYGFTELLSKTNLNKNQNEMLNIVRSSVEILMAIINDILDFSKIESGKLNIENYPFNLEKSIINIKELFSHKAKEKNLELNFFIDKKLPKIINADKIRLSQIITNLIGNAIKFTDKGFVELTVRLEEESVDKITVSFSVKDSGIGIQREKIDAIIERFQQADNEITRKYGGTGLGLSISKSLIEMQGGKLTIESEFGIGSTFSFTLNFNKISESNLQKFVNKEKKGKRYKIEEEKLKFNESLKKIIKKEKVEVLILEDTIFNYTLIEKIFENTIINLDYAENGKLGLQKFEKKSYDMILLDLQMPEMDGFEFAKILRNVKRCDILMLAMTANNSGSEKQKCLDIGIDDYFTKPFERKSLLDGILRNFNNIELKNKTNHNSKLINENADTNINNISVISLQGSCNSNNTNNNNNTNNANEDIDGSINIFFDDCVLKNDFNFTISNCNLSNSVLNIKRGLSVIGDENIKSKRNRIKRKSSKCTKIKLNNFENNEEEEEKKLEISSKSYNSSKISNNVKNNDNLEKKINFLSDFTAKENFLIEESDQSQEELETLKVIKKGNLIKFFINEEEYQSDLNLLEKSNNFKNSNLKINSSFLDTETEPEIVINTQMSSINNNIKKRVESNNSNNYTMSGFSTQDEITKEKKANFSDTSLKDSFNNNSNKKFSLFQTQSLRTLNNNQDNNYYELKDLNDFSDQEKIIISESFNNTKNITLNLNSIKKSDKRIKSNITVDSICASDYNSSFDVYNFTNLKMERSENDLITKTRFKKLKSKFSIGEYEKNYYSNNHSVNSIIKDSRDVKSECFTCKKRYLGSKKLNKSKFRKRNYKNDHLELLDDVKDYNHVNVIYGNNHSNILTKKGFSSSDEQELVQFNSSLKNKKANSDNNNNKSYNFKDKSNKIFSNFNNFGFETESGIESFNDLKEDIFVDFNYLEEISAGDFDFQKELALIFLSETPIQIRNLKEACEKVDYKEIHLLTHSLKTSFNMLGVANIKEKFLSMEKLVKNIKDSSNLQENINNNQEDIVNNINDFKDWLINDYPFVFNLIEDKISSKYAKINK